MPGQFSQIDLVADGSGPPDQFVQLRFPNGETADGKIWFYAPNNNTAVLVEQATIDVSTAPTAFTPFDGGDGFTYYTYNLDVVLTATEKANFINQVLRAPNDKLFTVAHTNETGDNYADLASVVAFGDQEPGGGAQYVDGPLDGEQLKDVDDQPFFEGSYQEGYDPAMIIDPGGGIVVGPGDPDAPSCFLTGTHIETPSGPVPVEQLRAGDLVCCAGGGSVPVLWMGHVSVRWPFRPVERLMPVCIDAGALAPGVPVRDLTVTADHALLLDGVLVNAAALVNGTTIRRLDVAASDPVLTFWHIETEAHDMILAEGVAAETFVDNVSRQSFDNFDQYLASHGAEREIEESATPRAMSPRQVPKALRTRIDAQVDAVLGPARRSA